VSCRPKQHRTYGEVRLDMRDRPPPRGGVSPAGANDPDLPPALDGDSHDEPTVNGHSARWPLPWRATPDQYGRMGNPTDTQEAAHARAEKNPLPASFLYAGRSMQPPSPPDHRVVASHAGDPAVAGHPLPAVHHALPGRAHAVGLGRRARGRGGRGG